MTITEKVNNLKNDLLKICDIMGELDKSGIRIEFNIVNGKLEHFRALQQMKLDS